MKKQSDTWEKAYNALTKAISLCERNGIATYDPFDIKGTPIILWTYEKSTLIRRLIRFSLYANAFILPNVSRQIMGIVPLPSAGGVASLATCYCYLYKLTEDESWVAKSRNLLEWLVNNRANTSIGEGWGLPFDWQSFKVIPSGTPTSYTSVQCAEAFLAYYEITNDDWALEHLQCIGEFLFKGLNELYTSSGLLALSYTPIDDSIVFNVNASMANMLMLVGRLTNTDEYYKFGLKLLPLVFNTQNIDGSWGYSISGNSGIDGYHTGMIIEALARAHENLTKSSDIQNRCESVISKATNYYLEKLFDKNGIALTYPGKPYPLDIYSFYQAIITLNLIQKCSFLGDEQRKRARYLIHLVVENVISLMMETNGEFIYRKYRFKKLNLYSLRWAQAPMCLALTTYCTSYYRVRTCCREG